MPTRINASQRQQVLRLLAEGHDRETIAATVGVTPGQVSAVAAHVKMGTYALPNLERTAPTTQLDFAPAERLFEGFQGAGATGNGQPQIDPIFLGQDMETGESVHWNPDPANGATNPHVLMLGESGAGKTYAICCMLAELAHEGIVSVVFDYGQGFSPESLPKEFTNSVELVEVNASRDGVDINPLQIFPSDVHGPVNVAQRVADTFARVYTKIGVQQHGVLRQAVLDALERAKIKSGSPESWSNDLPPFKSVHSTLDLLAASGSTPQSRHAASVASHVATLFFFNTLRPNGKQLAWTKMLRSRGCVFVIQLKGLEFSLERAVTEFLLWSLIGFIESIGPGPLRMFVVLDEAHKLSFDRGSPVEKLLREGRKFGLGLILASQQPDDFSAVAFANASTKVIFQVADDRSTVSRQLHRKIKNAHTFGNIYHIITKLPRGHAYVVTENRGRVVRIAHFSERGKWKCS